MNTLGGDDASEALLTASQRRVDAAVLIGTQFDENIRRSALGARRVKKLVVFARTSTSPDTISIGCDDVAAMGEITRHVLSRGYRRPLFLAGPDTQSTRLMRKETFLGLWADERGGSAPAVIHADSYSINDGFSALLHFLSGLAASELPDVVLCENDVLALGAMDAIRHGLGLRVPHDIGVTGFDDIPLAAAPAYDLTTYRQPITEMAIALIRLRETEGNTHEPVILQGLFIQRG